MFYQRSGYECQNRHLYSKVSKVSCIKSVIELSKITPTLICFAIPKPMTTSGNLNYFPVSLENEKSSLLETIRYQKQEIFLTFYFIVEHVHLHRNVLKMTE